MVLLLSKEHAEQWRVHNRWHWIIAALLALLLLYLWATGRGPNAAACCGVVQPVAAVVAPAVVSPPTAPTPDVAAPPATPPSQDATAAGPPAANLYFETANAELPQGAAAALAPIITYLQANPAAKAFISGYHDPTGNAASNDKLAENRAKSVREALAAAGVSTDRVVMEKPRDTTGTGDLAQARRVEVSVR